MKNTATTIVPPENIEVSAGDFDRFFDELVGTPKTLAGEPLSDLVSPQLGGWNENDS